MPNHVTNRITVKGGLLKQFISETKGTYNDQMYPTFDFNQFIPQPAIIAAQKSTASHVKTAAEIALGLIDLADTSVMPADPLSNMRDATKVLHRSNAIRQLQDGPMPKDFSDEDFESFVTYLKAWKECDGTMDWYDWNCRHWGTKWNAYDVEVVSDDVITFDTAWAAPHPVIAKLVDMLGVEVKHEWADEDTGRNVGIAIYDPNGGGKYTELDETKEGYELYFELKGDDYREGWKWDGTKYVYNEEEVWGKDEE